MKQKLFVTSKASIIASHICNDANNVFLSIIKILKLIKYIDRDIQN